MQKRLKTKLAAAGAGNIAVGVVILICGVVCGVLSIVNGALVLGSRRELEV